MKHLQGRKPGPAAYNAGCRCPLCTELNRLRGIRTCERLRKLGLTHPELIPHGTSGGYGNWGCRCAQCVAANSASCRAYRRTVAANAAVK